MFKGFSRKAKIAVWILIVLNWFAWGCKKDDGPLSAPSVPTSIVLLTGFGTADTIHLLSLQNYNFAALNLTEFDSVRASFTAGWEPPSLYGFVQLYASGEQFYIGDSLTSQKSFSRTIHSYQITIQNDVRFRFQGSYVKVWGFRLVGWRKP